MKIESISYRVFLISVTTVAALLLGSAIFQTVWTYDTVVHLLIFGILAIASESLPVRISNMSEVTVSFAVIFAAFILFPAGVSLAVAGIGPWLIIKKDAIDRRIFNGAQMVISLKLASFVTVFFNFNGFKPSLTFFFVFLVAGVSYTFINIAMVAFAVFFSYRKSPWEFWLRNIRWSFPNFLALALLGFLLALVYDKLGPLGLGLLFGPLLISRFSFQKYVDMKDNYFKTIEACVKAVEAKDEYTKGHSERVAKYAIAIAQELRLREDRLECIKYAALLHDLGKIGVSEAILNKEGHLLDEEWEAIRNHPVVGDEIIKDMKFLYHISPGVKHHHERFDGLGYPDGLKGVDIPQEARIIAVADCYDAMTSNRSYRKGLRPVVALEELRRVAGSQLDPEMVGIFCKVVTVNDHAEYAEYKDENSLGIYEAIVEG